MEFFKKINGDSASLTKSALVFYEGNHKDSNGRKHDFNAERLQSIVVNTNQKIQGGERIPFQRDHKKTQDYNLGDVEGNFRTEIITKENLPNPKHKHLLGKLGVWVDKVVVKGSEAVQKVIDGSIRTISAGIDPVTESFMEVSATPFPALVGPALFSSVDVDSESEDVVLLEFNLEEKEDKDLEPLMNKNNSKVYSMEEALGLGKQKENIKNRYDLMSDALYKVLETLYMASDEDLKGKNPVESSYQAISFFVEKIEELFKLTEEKNPIESLGKTDSNQGARKIPFRKKLSETNNFSQFTKKRVKF